MDIQSVLAYIVLVIAISFLVKKFFFKKKKNGKDCGDDCNCH